MSQEINLLRPVSRKSAFSLTFAHAIVYGALATAALAVIISLYENHQLNRVQAEALALDRKVKDARLAHEKAIAQRKGRKPDAAAEAALAELTAQLKSREEIVDALKSGVVGTTAGFSDYMLALSRQSITGVWLTGFDIAAGGEEITLAGRALTPDLVPAYLQRLTQESPLQGRRFASMLINQAPPAPSAIASADEAKGPAGQKGPPYVEFRISSAPADASRAPDVATAAPAKVAPVPPKVAPPPAPASTTEPPK